MRLYVWCAAVALPLTAQVSNAPTGDSKMPWDAGRFPSKQYFREIMGPDVPRYELRPPARLTDYAAGDKLELSLKAYLDLVLANNTDLEIQRVNLEIPKNAITRAFGIFDPFLNTTFSATRSNTQATDVLAGAATVSNLSQPFNSRYQQLLPFGTQIYASFGGQKYSTNSQYQTYNPAYNTNINAGFTQPLLRGRGRAINMLQVSIARSQLKVQQQNISNQILTILAAAERAYWDVVEARENLRVQENFLQLTKAALDRSQRELELGAISALDIYQPKQQYANAEFQVTQARFVLAQREDALRRQAGIDLDPEVRKLPIVLTESVTPPTDELTFDKEALVQRALQLRPDYRAAVQQLDVDELSITGARNSLLPDLRIGGAYTTTGRGGIFFPRTVDDLTGVPLAPIPGGIGDAFDQMFRFGYPVYALTLSLNLPLRNRAAAADLADAGVRKRRDMLQVRTTEQAIRLEVLNAVTGMESSLASLKLAKIARDFAQQRVDAEQKKYELGTSVIFFVLQAQQDLTTAESNMVREAINFRRNNLLLQQRTGELLQERGIVIQ